MPGHDHGPSNQRSRLLGGGTLLLVGLLALAACEETGQNPPVDPPSVAGSWSGSATLSGQTFPASFTFTQSGSIVGGTAQIDGLFPSTAIEAAIDGAGTLVMLLEPGCEVWLAQMAVAPDETSMTGPLSVDRTGCPQGVGDGGVLSLNRD